MLFNEGPESNLFSSIKCHILNSFATQDAKFEEGQTVCLLSFYYFRFNFSKMDQILTPPTPPFF